MARDNFTQNVKNILKDRVGGHCSNPLCMRDTVGPKGNIGKTISEFIISYLNRINFHYEHDQIGIYNNYWSKFFEMLEENYEELDDLKEQFDGECFKLCE